jgi:hypothetical protein
MKKVRSYEKGTKGLRRGHKISFQVTKKVRSYEKDTKLRKKKRSYEKIRRYGKGRKRLRNKLRKVLVTKLPSYEIVTPPNGIICYDV